jgi:hypothetical protein
MIHPFEKSGLGKAPFKVAGYELSLHGGNGVPVKAGSSCDHCGTSIAHVFWIRGSDGSRFKVGSSCVMKTPDRELKKEVKETKARVAREAKEKSRKQEREERQAAFAAARKERQEQASAKYTEHLRKLDEMAGGKNEYRKKTSVDISAKIRDGMPVTERMATFIDSLYAEHTAIRTHVGKLGEVLDVEAVVSFVVYVGTFKIEGTWQSSDVYRWHFKDAAGNVLIWKTSKSPYGALDISYNHKEHGLMSEGFKCPDVANVSIRLRGKVKKHDTYQDEPQTILERCKIVLVSNQAAA